MARWLAAVAFVIGVLVFARPPGARPLYPLTPAPEPVVVEPDRFDAASAGTIHGRVTWDGDVPSVRPFNYSLRVQKKGFPGVQRANPLAPGIDPATKGVEGVVVHLRGVDPRRSRPWDHPPVRVEVGDDQLVLRQGEHAGPVAFTRPGGEMEIVSVSPSFQGLRARGAEFFGFMFPDPERPLTRKVRHKGITELSNAAQLFWQRAYLFADDHPYYTRTDKEGRFRLEKVPPGSYEVVCWAANWKEADRERDPETSRFARLRYGPPVERTVSVTVATSGDADVSFTLSGTMFQP